MERRGSHRTQKESRIQGKTKQNKTKQCDETDAKIIIVFAKDVPKYVHECVQRATEGGDGGKSAGFRKEFD